MENLLFRIGNPFKFNGSMEKMLSKNINIITKPLKGIFSKAIIKKKTYAKVQ